MKAGLEWSTSKALAAGATEEEVTGVLLAVAPVIGLGRLVAAAPGVADGFGYDVEAAMEDRVVTDGLTRQFRHQPVRGIAPSGGCRRTLATQA